MPMIDFNKFVVLSEEDYHNVTTKENDTMYMTPDTDDPSRIDTEIQKHNDNKDSHNVIVENITNATNTSISTAISAHDTSSESHTTLVASINLNTTNSIANHNIAPEAHATEMNQKADKATTLAGYGITDAATSIQGGKADTAIQSAKIGDVEVTKTGTELEFPLYPTTLPANGGNADTATKLQTARTINGVSFDGGADIAVADNTKEPIITKNNAFNKNFGTVNDTVCQGDDSRLSNARPASDVQSWAKAASKPAYTASEVGAQALATTLTVSLTAAGWTGSVAPFSQVVTINGLKVTSAGSYGLSQTATLAERSATRNALISGVQSTNTLTFYADGEKPTINLPIYIEFFDG